MVSVAGWDAAAVTSQNQGLFQRLQGISAPALRSTSCSTSDFGVPVAISHFFPPPPLPVQCFQPFPKYIFLEVLQGWRMAVSSGGSIVKLAMSGMEQALVSSHKDHSCSQHLAMDT